MVALSNLLRGEWPHKCPAQVHSRWRFDLRFASFSSRRRIWWRQRPERSQMAVVQWPERRRKNRPCSRIEICIVKYNGGGFATHEHHQRKSGGMSVFWRISLATCVSLQIWHRPLGCWKSDAVQKQNSALNHVRPPEVICSGPQFCYCLSYGRHIMDLNEGVLKAVQRQRNAELGMANEGVIKAGINGRC